MVLCLVIVCEEEATTFNNWKKKKQNREHSSPFKTLRETWQFTLLDGRKYLKLKGDGHFYNFVNLQ